MNKRLMYIIIGVVVVVVVVTGGYLVINGNHTNNSVNMPSNNTNNTTQNSTPGTVNIQNFAFSPSTITVNKGDMVTWQNNDSATHHVVADDGSFDLGDQASGATVKFTFTKTGTFNYHCSIHPSMKGVVIVK